jgi:hypothetical protein
MFDTWRSSSIDLYPKNGFLVYALDPGMYSLREVIAYPIESHNLSNMVSFSARPGEVVYIGDLILRGDLILDKKENALFLAQILNVGDSFEDAKLFVKKRYSDIASVPVKRLMQLSEKVKNYKRLQINEKTHLGNLLGIHNNSFWMYA